MASRNVSAGNSGNLAEIDSDPEDVPTSSLAEGRTLRGPKRAINYGDRMPYRQGTATQLLQLHNRSFSLKNKVQKTIFKLEYISCAVRTVEIKNLFKIDKFCFAIFFGSKIAYCVLLISMYCILQQSNFKECTVFLKIQ